jgi:hypothetical protein
MGAVLVARHRAPGMILVSIYPKRCFSPRILAAVWFVLPKIWYSVSLEMTVICIYPERRVFVTRIAGTAHMWVLSER